MPHSMKRRARLSGHSTDSSNFAPLECSIKLPSNVHAYIDVRISSMPSPENVQLKGETSKAVTAKDSVPTNCTASLASNGDIFTHCLSLGIAESADEMLFVMWVKQLGLPEATKKAAKFRLQHQRPLQALREVLSESGRSCNAQNAKRKRPSGSPASSRKR